jgi:hypothetical protein
LEPNLPLLSILNTRYVIWPVHSLGPFSTGEAVMATSLDGTNAYEAVYEIPTLPRARLVGRATVLPEEEVLPYLLSPAFRPAEEVVLTEEPPLELPGRAPEGEVRWLERGSNRLRLEVETDAPALLVLSANWYPRWRARVGEQDTPILRANHTLRAIPVPLGVSGVEVYMGPGAMKGPLFLSLASLLLLTLLFLRSRGREGPATHESGSEA